MRSFLADLHIHTILSPCGTLEMSPKNIVEVALEKKLDIIGITDHNSTRQCKIVMKEAENKGLTVYPGVEVTTREEIHCLAFFSNLEETEEFQLYLDEQLPFIKNNPSLFGDQVVVDEEENIVFEEEKLLISAIQSSIDQVESEVHRLNGIFIPAHVNKAKDSLLSQLGFIPKGLNADAYEINRHISKESFIENNRLNSSTTVIRNSDSHMLDSIGEQVSTFEMESTDFNEFRLALKNQSGRKVVLK
ncbi:MAG TPA: PHP domain-containing protein [Lentimicrobium sp.]|nr:PHP domain-containing protein [Lentimicrobium sp.]